MEVNHIEGQRELVLGGKSYVVKYPLRVCAILQRHFKQKSVFKLFGSVGEWSAQDIAFVIQQGLKASGSRPDCTVDELLDEMHLHELPYYVKTIVGAADAKEDDGEDGEKEGPLGYGETTPDGMT